MKLAVISESPADEAAIKILVDAIVGEETELVPLRLRPGGWPHVLQLLPPIIKAFAVPAIEAWYQCGVDLHVNEARWIGRLSGERINFTKESLKIAVYGTNQPSLTMEISAAVAAAKRLADNPDQLQQLFPNGFGCLLTDIRGWSHG
jgi:hypothetical protein